MGGKPKTTDLLLTTVELAANGREDEYQVILGEIYEKHRVCAEELLNASERDRVLGVVQSDISGIRDILRAVSLTRGGGGALKEIVSGYGELWSTQIMAALLNANVNDTEAKFYFVDARRVLRVEESPMGPEIQWEESAKQLHSVLQEAGDRSLVITGYIASTTKGGPTTLKRDGSDFSASIFGRLLCAKEISIWTDVDGVLTADPRRVPDAQVLSDVSYNEAIELAYFGAKVIHPKTMNPAIHQRIPIYIRNTFNHTAPGTRIFETRECTVNRKTCVAGFTTIDDVALINVEGTGMIGVVSMTERIFSVLSSLEAHVALIAQASSEHSVCFAIRRSELDAVKTALEEAFYREINKGHISHITTTQPCSIVAVVGDGMSSTPGVSGRLFEALGKAHVNVKAIAQGCDERNISIVVMATETEKALRTMHSAFLLSEITLSVGVIVNGSAIGAPLLKLLLQRRKWLQKRFGCDIRLHGIVSGERMVLPSEPLGDALECDDGSVIGEHVETLLATLRGADAVGEAEPTTAHAHTISPATPPDSQPYDFVQFINHVQTDRLPHTLVIDCSNDPTMAAKHVGMLARGVHVVTGNIHALAGSLEAYDAIMNERKLGKTHYGFEVAISGGLPLEAVLKPIVHGGDSVTSLAAVFSASLSHVLGRVRERAAGPDSPTVTFSTAMREAIDAGMMENDPWDDLIGVDTLKKFLVMARELGLALTEQSVYVEPLIAKEDVQRLADGSTDWEAYDNLLRRKMETAASRGNVLQYVARLDAKDYASIRLEEVPIESNLGRLAGGNVCICLWTLRYEDTPLVLQGPLGTPECTASGLLGDLLKLVSELGGRDRGPLFLRRTPSMEALANESRHHHKQANQPPAGASGMGKPTAPPSKSVVG